MSFLIWRATRKYNIYLKQTLRMEIEIEPSMLVIGYFPFRAKAQLIRLLCEFLHIPYQDRFFTPDEWCKFKETEGKRWVVRDMPFIQHEGFLITGTWAPVRYIIDLANCHQLLGKTQRHRIRLDQMKNKVDLKDSILNLITTNRSPGCSQQKKKCLRQFYQRKIEPPLLHYEQECCTDSFFFGYLTVIDFIIYEIINHLNTIYSAGLYKLPKLVALRNRVAEIPSIKAYQESSRAVKDVCPVQFFQKFKEQKLSAGKSSTQTHKGCQEMDPQ